MPPSHSNPETLLLVRSTLEMLALLRPIYPSRALWLDEVETETRGAGQSLIDAASIPAARLALTALHRARLKLQQIDGETERETERFAA